MTGPTADAEQDTLGGDRAGRGEAEPPRPGPGDRAGGRAGRPGRRGASAPAGLLKATTRFFWETARLDRSRRHAAASLRLPLLLLQGEDDAMMDVAGTRQWFSRLGVEDKTYRAYPGAGHTLDFEPDRSRCLADMVGWLSARVSPESSRSTGGGP
jgi:alpha-beta hydrolase superfamily lysophospholipase